MVGNLVNINTKNNNHSLKVILIIVFIMISLFNFTGCSKFSCTSYGQGTKEDPYLIYNTEQMNDLGGLVLQGNNFDDTYFKLMNDLDFQNKKYYPIGSGLKFSFNGHFDGNNKTLSNIKIDSYSTYLGVFGYISDDAFIYNLKVENIDIYGRSDDYSYAGAIVGFADNIDGEIYNCYASGNIKLKHDGVTDVGSNTIKRVKNYAGGIIGVNYAKYAYNLKSSVNVDSEVSGGVIGLSGSHSIMNIHSFDSNIYGDDIAGGLIGITNYVWYGLQASISDSTTVNTNIITKCVAGSIVGYTIGYLKIQRIYVDSSLIGNQKEGVSLNIGGVVGVVYMQYQAYVETGLSLYLTHAIVNARITINNLTTDSNKFMTTYFLGRKKRQAGYSTPVVENSLFNGYMHFKIPVEGISDEATIFKQSIINVSSENNASLNTDIIKNVLSLKEAAYYLGVDYRWLIYSNNLYKLNIPEDKFEYLSGSGTSNDPYLITTIEEFSYIFLSDDKKRYFKISNDIDATNLTPDNYISYNIPSTSQFELDGNNKTISNFNANNKQILLNGITDSIIKNLTFNNLSIDSNTYSLFSNMSNTAVININIDGNIAGEFKLNGNNSQNNTFEN